MFEKRKSKDRLWRKIKSFACALVLALLIFSVYPLSQVASEDSEEFLPNSAVEISTFSRARKLENKLSVSNVKSEIFVEIKRENISPQNVKISLDASDFGSLKFFDSGVKDALSNGDISLASDVFSIEENNTASLEAFEFADLDRVPNRLKSVQVEYPSKLLNRGIEGEVVMSIFINQDGTVELDKVISATNSQFEKSAKNALGKLLFEPPMRAGKAVRARFILPIPFKILK